MPGEFEEQEQIFNDVAGKEMIPGETEESLHRWLSLKLPEPSASLSL